MKHRIDYKTLFEMKKLLFILLIISMLFSCNRVKDQKGIAFTFDDRYVEEWYSARDLFNKYNIHATFFIGHPEKLTEEEVSMLHKLQDDGHEIACHSMNHIDAPEFLKDHSIDEYIKQEIFPAIEKMKQYGFDVKTYAYPFGKNTPESDKALLKYFKVLRKATYNIENCDMDKIDRTFTKINKDRVVDAMGIDYEYKISPSNLETAIKRANFKNEILVLHAHKIVDTGSGYAISRDYLEQAFKFAQQYQLKSLRISELND